ncbi:metallophosphoesterase [Bdellovibrio sp. HCB2-146]|uniref:metallophosphoesterase n=1 Tax=Bdellovibrio sp. HCB2-146 TaxID=3394362 RepID=UPI0039BC87DD
MGLFRAVIIILFLGIFFYVSHQLLRFTDLTFAPAFGVIVFLALMFGLVLSMPLYFWSERRLQHKPWHDAFFAASHFALAYINFLGTLVILRDIAGFAVHYLPLHWTTEWMQKDLYGTTATGLLLILPFIMILIGTVTVRIGPRVKTMKLRFADLPAAWEGLRILHITDLHIGASLPQQFVEKLVLAAEKVKADLVVYTGDILDGSAVRHLTEIEMLKKIQAPLGSFYVTGNHEYYWQIGQALAAFRSLGFHVLLNDVINVQKDGHLLQVGGVPDPAAAMAAMEGPNFKKLQQQFKEKSFRILLSHQPSLAPQAAEAGFHLQLSGHTHGGQFFPWNFLIGFFQKYAKGLYHIKNLQLYVNQGTGYWGPSLRMGTYCELTEIILTRGEGK